MSASAGDANADLSSPTTGDNEERKKLIRKEGGLFAFDTKYGALNPFAIYYGLVAIFFGIPWFVALSLCQFLYFVTGRKLDKQVSEGTTVLESCKQHQSVLCNSIP
jgi:hypothetical protein